VGSRVRVGVGTVVRLVDDGTRIGATHRSDNGPLIGEPCMADIVLRFSFPKAPRYRLPRSLHIPQELQAAVSDHDPDIRIVRANARLEDGHLRLHGNAAEA